MAVASRLGAYLAVTGNVRSCAGALQTHIVASIVGVAGMASPFAWQTTPVRGPVARLLRRACRRRGLSGGLPLVRRSGPVRTPTPTTAIVNPLFPPMTPDARRRWPRVAVLPLVGEDQRRRDHSRRTSSSTPSRVASATRMSTSSGRARCTTSRRSTTSSTGNRSNTCRPVRHPAEEVVRRLSRPRGVLQRPLREAD